MNPVERIRKRFMLGEVTRDDVSYLLAVADTAEVVLDAHDEAAEPDADMDWTAPLIDTVLRHALRSQEWVS